MVVGKDQMHMVRHLHKSMQFNARASRQGATKAESNRTSSLLIGTKSKSSS
jgi:hypothetical protein